MWSCNGLDGEDLRQWFRDKLDGLINLKAGLRSDGAPARWRGRAADDRRFRRFVCRCRRCEHDRAYHHDNTSLRPRVSASCTHCNGLHVEWGGRKWESDYYGRALRDQQALGTPRRSVRRFETEDVRRRFADRERGDD